MSETIRQVSARFADNFTLREACQFSLAEACKLPHREFLGLALYLCVSVRVAWERSQDLPERYKIDDSCPEPVRLAYAAMDKIFGYEADGIPDLFAPSLAVFDLTKVRGWLRSTIKQLS